MAPSLIEESFEATDAILKGDWGDACAELGDVLANVFLIATIADQSGRFGVADVARAIDDKLVRRHPHVFGDAERSDASGTVAQWETLKREERKSKGSALDGVPQALPALLRAFRCGQKAARLGFDWPDHEGPRRKVDEELGELDEALSGVEGELKPGDPRRQHAQSELGDVLFSLCNLARHYGLEPETALRETVDRFSGRFRQVERELGDRLSEATLEEMEAAWSRAKERQRGSSD